MSRRRVQTLLAAVALVATTGAGRVVRVDAPTVREVRIPAGWFEMGLGELQARDAIAACRVFPSFEGINAVTNAPVEFCTLYGLQLATTLQRPVYLSAFMIDRDEVSVDDYRACVAAGSCVLDPLVAGDERYVSRDGLPMVNVTWGEAGDFCHWRGARLPTEAEWERAARGTDPEARWPWGALEQPNDFNHGQARSDAMRELDREPQLVPTKYFGDPDPSDGHEYAAPPGSYAWGESAAGTRDQAGNVAEWTADALGVKEGELGYLGLDPVNPQRRGDANASRVVRGGSWRQPAFLAQSNLRDPFIEIYEPHRRFTHVGFRCARAAR